MNSRLSLRPDLNECVLEDRLLPVIANFGTILLTQSGLTFLIPFPGANTSAAGSLGSSGPSGGSSSSVSGVPVPTSLYVTGTAGISSLRPGNITGVPSLAAGVAGPGGISVTIQVGSGADTSDGPTAGGATNNVVGRATVADPTQRPAYALIGGPLASSSTTTDSTTQTYQDNAPVPPPTPLGVVNQQGTSTGMSNGGSSMPNPQLGSTDSRSIQQQPRSGQPAAGLDHAHDTNASRQ